MCEGEYPDLLRIVWQQWKRIFRVRSLLVRTFFVFLTTFENSVVLLCEYMFLAVCCPNW